MILRADATAPAAARAHLEAVADAIAADRLGDLRLMLSELVANAVRHGNVEEGRIRLAIRVAHGRVRVAVTDGGNAVPAPRARSDGEESGWGLHIVEALSSSWGTDTERGTRVWFEIEAAGRRRAPRWLPAAAAVSVAVIAAASAYAFAPTPRMISSQTDPRVARAVPVPAVTFSAAERAQLREAGRNIARAARTLATITLLRLPKLPTVTDAKREVNRKRHRTPSLPSVQRKGSAPLLPPQITDLAAGEAAFGVLQETASSSYAA